jgi:SHS2 domain-containing protein
VRKPFTEIDHSGDVGIEARGGDVREMLENATLGLFSLLCWNNAPPGPFQDPSRTGGQVEAVVERPIRVEAESIEDLVVDWLNEVIAMTSAHGELYTSVTVRNATERSAEGLVRGESVDRDRHDLRFEVKAATYHALSVTRDENGARARVIFDL